MAVLCVAAEHGGLIEKKKKIRKNKVQGYNLRRSRLTSGGLINSEIHMLQCASCCLDVVDITAVRRTRNVACAYKMSNATTCHPGS